jgi:hypothetical protein
VPVGPAGGATRRAPDDVAPPDVVEPEEPELPPDDEPEPELEPDEPPRRVACASAMDGIASASATPNERMSRVLLAM